MDHRDLQGDDGGGRVTRAGASGLGPVGPAARHQRAGALAGAFAGEPGEVADMIRRFLDAWVQHLIVELAAGAGPESIGRQDARPAATR
jgi:hypothetical protein